MGKVTVRIETEGCDVYYETFPKKPTREQIAKAAWEADGKCADLQFYLDTVRYEIVPTRSKK